MISSCGHFTINNYGIDTSVLTIRNVTSLEHGEYYCVVNEWVKQDGDWWTKTRSRSGYITGNNYCNYILQLLVLIIAVTDNSVINVNHGEHVILSCNKPMDVVSSSSVVWSKDGVEMSEIVRVTIT